MRKVLICLFAALLLLFGSLTAMKLMEYRKSSQTFQQLAGEVVSQTPPDVQEESQEKERKTEVTQPVYDETAPISVDFEKLIQENADCIGWLYSEDTPINYPVMQSEDNEKYLNDSFYGIRDFAGCLFLDCEGSADFSRERNIIFGHNMQNDSMFGSLDGYSWGSQSYYEKHRVMYLLTPDQNYRLDVLAGTYVAEDAQLFGDGFIPGWLEGMQKESTFNAWKDHSDSQRYLLLSTCSGRGNELRYVIVCGMKPIG